MGDEVLAVIPQQAVGKRPDELLGPPGHVLVGKRRSSPHPVHVVHQDLGAVREVLQGVHAHRGALVHAAEDEPLVGDDGADELLVLGERGEDVGDQVSDFVVAQVDAIVGENGSGHLQQVSPAQERGRAAVRMALPLLFLNVRPAEVKKFEFGEEAEFLHQEGQQLQHGESLRGKYPNFPDSRELFIPAGTRRREDSRTLLATGGRGTCAFCFINVLNISPHSPTPRVPTPLLLCFHQR